MWPRVHGLRALELGTPGPMRARLNALALAGEKTATAGALAAYERDEEAVEHVGERLALIDDDGARVGIVEVVDVELLPFCEVGLRFARAEGEGFETVEQWRAAHARFFAAVGIR